MNNMNNMNNNDNNQRPYGTLPPGALRIKRKDRESSSFPTKRPPPPRAAVPAFAPIEMTSSNKLLAGYLAYEYLTKGTLLGQKLDASAAMANIRPAGNGNESYEQITSLLMMKTDGGDRISGIVNPTELDRWIGM